MPEIQTVKSAPAMTGRGASTVTVACKMPNGIVLRAWKMEDYDEPVLGGGVRKSTKAVDIPDPADPFNPWSFTLKGNAIDVAKLMKMDMPNIAHGYALTPGVPKDLWELWYEQNQHSGLVRNKLVYALPSDASIRDWAHDHQATRSGLEPIDQDSPGRAANLPQIERGQVE